MKSSPYSREKEKRYKPVEVMKIMPKHQVKNLKSNQKHHFYILIAFNASEIPRKGLIQTSLQAATTGANFNFSLATPGVDITIKRYTKGEQIKISSEIESSALKKKKKKSSMNFTSGDTSASIGLEADSEFSEKTKASYESMEASLVDTMRSETEIHWSLKLHKGQKVFRDYLEGNFPLEVDVLCDKGATPAFRIQGSADNVLIFDQNGKLIKGLALLMLKVKLNAQDFNIPKPWLIEIIIPNY